MENINEETAAVTVGLNPAHERLHFPSPEPEEEIDRRSARTKEINALVTTVWRESRNADLKEPSSELTQPTDKDWTYLVFDGKKYKIGRSRSPEERLKSLRTANPTCVLVGQTQKIGEKDLHIIFREKRIAGEWFDLSEEDLAKITGFFEKGICPENLDLAVHHFRKARKQSGYEKYVIGFGKYKGVKLIDMVTPEQISYLEWFVREKRQGNLKRNELKRAPYAAFRWWLS